LPWILAWYYQLFILCVYRFKAKYSPEEFDKHQEESRLALKHRCSVFNKLLELGRVDNISVDVDKSDGIVKLLDAGMCKLPFLVIHCDK